MSAISLACRTCGRAFAFPAEAAVWECPACGAVHGRPRSQGECLDWLRRANMQRAACDFSHAETDYRSVLLRHPEEHEALWGLVLCKYGVEYVKDLKTKECRPTLHFLRRRPILEDADFRLACQRAPEELRVQYLADAQYVSAIQQALLQDDADSARYDVFLCYKGSASTGKGFAREHDCARDLYCQLREDGYRVFFAHETLKHVAGANYEAQIFHALYSARVMLVVCSDPQSLASPWVHSEWSRYLERIDAGEKCRLIPLLYDGCDPYALPDEFVRRSIQALRMDELTSLDALRANLRQNLHPTPVEHREPAGQADEATGALLSIEYMLENSQWDDAARDAAALIRKYPRCAMAYLYKLLGKLQLSGAEKLRQQSQPFEKELDWQWAMRLADDRERETLTGILNDSLARRRRIQDQQRRAEEKRLAEEKRKADEERLAEERRLEEERRAAEAERLEAERMRLEAERRMEQERLEKARQEAEKRRIAEEKTRQELAERLAAQEKCAEVRKLLSEGSWSEADAAARQLPDCPQKPLLQLLAKYRLNDEQGLAVSRKRYDRDVLWDDALKAEPDRADEMYRYRAQRTKRVEHRRKWRLGLLYFAAMLALMVGFAAAVTFLPYHNMVALGTATLVFEIAILYGLMDTYRGSGIALRVLLMILVPVAAVCLIVFLPDMMDVHIFCALGIALAAVIAYLNEERGLWFDEWAIRWQLVWLVLVLGAMTALILFPQAAQYSGIANIVFAVLTVLIALRQGFRFGRRHCSEP